MSESVALLWLIVFAVCVFIYAIPVFIAFGRRHPNRWIIFLLWLFVGPTFIGWCVALVWSLNKFKNET
jgi:hypothetical protein